MAAERNERVEALIAAWVLRTYRDGADNVHLRTCETARLTWYEISNGVYGCDTGCDAVVWSATVVCDCGEREEVDDTRELGQMSTVIHGLEALEKELG